MSIYLKHIDKPVFLKSYDGLTGDIQFTDKMEEGKRYQNEWFAKAELSYLSFHFPEKKEEYLNHMIPYST